MKSVLSSGTEGRIRRIRRVPRVPDALRRRILAVDSAVHFRLYLLDVLTEAGHCVVTARDGREALRLAKEWLPTKPTQAADFIERLTRLIAHTATGF